MRIKRVSLRNFGRHEAIDWDTDSPVVGVIGPNSAGKSTVLSGVKFGITGEADDPLPTYVRNNEGNATVELEFVKDGQTGRIFRQIGKTPKRKLNWDGREMTAAKQVDETMAKIFGADKQAIANAVFIQQGTLERILFALDSEKRKDFIQIVNLGFCEKHARIIDAKIKKIEATIEDLTGAIDLARSQRDEALTTFTSRRQEFETMPDLSEPLKFAREIVQAQGDIAALETQIGRLTNESLVHAHNIKRLLADVKMESLEQVEAALQQAVEQRNKFKTDHTSTQSIYVEFTHLDRLEEDIRGCQTRSRELLQQIQDANPDKLTADQIKAEIDRLGECIKQHNDYQRLRREIEQKDSQIQQQEVKIKALGEAPYTDENIEALQQEVNQICNTLTNLKRYEQMQKEIAQACVVAPVCASTGVECIKCGLTIANPQALSPEELKKLSDSVAHNTQQWNEAKGKLTTAKNLLQNYRTNLNDLTGGLNTLKQDRATKAQELDAIPVQEFTAEVQEQKRQNLISVRDRVATLMQQNADNLRSMAKKSEEKKRYTKAEALKANRELYTEARVNELAAAVQEWETNVSGWEKWVNDLKHYNGLKNQVDGQIKRAQDDQAEKANIVNRPVSETLAPMVEKMSGNWDAVKAELEHHQQTRTGLEGRKQEAESAYQTANTRYQDLETRCARDAGKRKLIADLQEIRETLLDDGLPMQYVRYHFDYLTMLTQDYLRQINANFQISPDTERELQFTFLRLDESNPVPLPMSKLSGGQRVRLCVAFLMAIQQRLVRNVGLLVLDEPTTHVDEEGVESFLGLFKTMQARLQNTEMQIFIVDHDPMMELALGKVLRLKKSEVQ